MFDASCPLAAPSPPEDPPRKASLPAPSVSTSEPAKKSSPVAVRAKKEDKELMSCPVVPGEETEIVIEKNRAGLGISIVGGRDTLLVSECCPQVNLCKSLDIKNINWRLSLEDNCQSNILLSNIHVDFNI